MKKNGSSSVFWGGEKLTHTPFQVEINLDFACAYFKYPLKNIRNIFF